MMNVMDIWFVVKTIVGETELDLPDSPIAVNHLKRLLDQVEIDKSLVIILFGESQYYSKIICHIMRRQISILERNRDSDAEWCQDMNCSTMIGKQICPNTCKEAGNLNV